MGNILLCPVLIIRYWFNVNPFSYWFNVNPCNYSTFILLVINKAQQHEHVFLFTVSGLSHISLFFKVHLYLKNYFLECIYVLGDQPGRSTSSFQIISFGEWYHPIFILLTNAKINLTHCCCQGWIGNSNFFCLNIFSFYPRYDRRRTSHLESNFPAEIQRLLN